MNLFKVRKIFFVVVFNKIDCFYGWKKIDNNGF